jgi:hypothetical protein
MALTSGTKLGPYEIQSPLGAGGMGEVYRSRDTRLDRTVAVEILPSHLSSNPEAKQRFEREARAISSVNHPHICTLYDVGHQDETDYLVIVSGRRNTRRPPAEGATATPAGSEIRHRDWPRTGKSPSSWRGSPRPEAGNIMLTKSGAKLMELTDLL